MDGTYESFNGVIKVIMSTTKSDMGLSDDAKILFMKLVLENRKKRDSENK